MASAPQDVLTIDPIAMNVVNRVALGSRLTGKNHFNGGLLVQGDIEGELEVRGRLIIWAGAKVSGRIKIWGDLYLFGQLGSTDRSAAINLTECLGTAYIASTGVSNGTLLAHRIRMYDGAQLHGPFKTLNTSNQLPELSELAVASTH
jgi:cytoskeletal protein CcmA (bactofilin family)